MRGKPVITAAARVTRLRQRQRLPWYGAWWVMTLPFWGLGLVQLGMILMWVSVPRQELVLQDEWWVVVQRVTALEAVSHDTQAQVRALWSACDSSRRPERKKWTTPWP